MRIRALAVALPLTMITGCATSLEATPPRAESSAVPDPAFLPWKPGATAITYDPAIVPAGSTAHVTIRKTGYGTEVTLTATGLIPRRMYGAHLHTGVCTGIPDEAGPHYQNHQDPVSPSTNPVYANPAN